MGRPILLSMGVLVSFAAPRRRGGRRRFIEDAMQVPLIAPLFDGAIDVVGDVHGEFGALRALLGKLGYDGNGGHPEGRRLVFVGDLVDRGPDSPSVLRLIRHLVARGAAQCILGNHELNLMRGSRKRGNLWFWGETETIRKGEGGAWPQALFTSAAERMATLAFLASLPLALEREDVAVVHAAWQPGSIERLRASRANDAAAAMGEFEEEVARSIRRRRLDRASQRGRDEIGLLEQNGNPVKVATSGLEGYAPRPFFASGRWRTLERIRWWESAPPPAGPNPNPNPNPSPSSSPSPHPHPHPHPHPNQAAWWWSATSGAASWARYARGSRTSRHLAPTCSPAIGPSSCLAQAKVVLVGGISKRRP